MLATLFLVSCSGGGGSAVAPDIGDPVNMAPDKSLSFQQGHNLAGYMTAHFDSISETIELRPHRTLEDHYNLSGLLYGDNCPGGSCIQWYVVGYDPIKSIYEIDMNLWNPSTLLAYDVRIVFVGLPYDEELEVGWEVANADSYHTFFDDDPLWDEDDQWLNPFIAFEKEDKEREFLPDPDGDGPDTYNDTETLELYMPPEGEPTGDIVFLLDVSWPDHCKEPYEISHMRQTEDLSPGDTTDTVFVEAVVADWQEDFVSVSLYMPDIISSNDGYIEMNMWPDTGPNAWPPDLVPPFDEEEIEFLLEYGDYNADTLRRFWCELSNEEEVEQGIYEAMIIAESVDTDWSGNEEDEVFDRIYNVFDFEVDQGGSGGDPVQKLQTVYTSYEGGDDADIYTYFFLNGKRIQLTNSGDKGSDELEPCINSGGTEICFISNYNKSENIIDDFEIYTMPIQYGGGDFPIDQLSENTNLWEQKTNNAWDDRMPEYEFNLSSNRLLYCSDEYGHFDIFWMNISVGEASRQRVTVHFADDMAPTWDRSDPLNEWIYYQSNRAGAGNYEIFGIKMSSQESSGNLPDRYTFTPGFDGHPTARQYVSMEIPAALAWTSERYGAPEIMLTDFVDSFRLTENQAIDMMPCFSTNGEWIAFASDRNDGNIDIYRMKWNGANVTRMTNNELPQVEPFYGGG